MLHKNAFHTDQKNDPTTGWERTLRLQKRIVRSSLVFIVVLTAALVVVILGPVRAALERRERAEFQTRAELITNEVANFFDQAVQLALQLPSRTRIREELAAFVRGDRTKESYVEFAGPKLEDAVDASPGMLACYRFDSTGTPLVGAYVGAAVLPPVLPAETDAYVFPTAESINGSRALFVQVPIRHGEVGLVGFDIVVISAESLVRSLAEFTRRTADAAVLVVPFAEDGTAESGLSSGGGEAADHLDAAAAALRNPNDPTAGNTSLTELSIDDRSHLVAASRFRTGWVALVHRSSATLHEATRSDTLVMLVIVVAAGAGATAVAWLVLRQLSRRTIAETEELSHIVDERTSELKTLLGEVHHRVKNDLMLINSFLALKEDRAESPEAKETLREAQGSLQTMGHVYELLHESAEYRVVPMRPLIEGLANLVADAGYTTPGTVETEVDAVTVHRRAAVLIGIIVNELITNAVKYGGGSGGGPLVTVVLSQNDAGELTLSVSNSGQPIAERVVDGDYGFGLSMVDALTAQLGGVMHVSNDPQPTVTVERVQPSA